METDYRSLLDCVTSQLLTINQARTRLGRDPVDGGDLYLDEYIAARMAVIGE